MAANKRDEGDVVLPQPPADEEPAFDSEPMSAPPARRFLGGWALVWLGTALITCVVLFAIWSVTR